MRYKKDEQIEMGNVDAAKGQDKTVTHKLLEMG